MTRTSKGASLVAAAVNKALASGAAPVVDRRAPDAKHTPGPWTMAGDSADWFTTNVTAAAPPYEFVAVQIRRANAARIVACVNACEGLSAEQLAQPFALSAVFGAERDAARSEVARLSALAEQMAGALEAVVSDLEWGTTGKYKGEGSAFIRSALAAYRGGKS